MKFKIRIKLWQVAVGFFCLAMTGFVIYSILHAINGNVTKSVAKEAASPKDESHYLRPLFFFFYIIFYFYFTINYYYWLIADNKKFLDYVKVTALLTLG